MPYRAQTDDDIRFSQTAQEPVRLEIALRRYFETEGERRERYASYLRGRVRPAARALIERGDPARLAALLELAPPSEGDLDDFITMARDAQRTELVAGLLFEKRARFAPRGAVRMP